jgi:GT2 family glycosyltransferase
MGTKVLIGIPTAGTLQAKTARSLMSIMKTPVEIIPYFIHGSYIAVNREKIAQFALKMNCTHVLFVDCDMEFTQDLLSRLLEHDKDIIGVLYNYRGILPLQEVTKFFDEERETDTIFKVAGLGTGCCLVKTSVFEKIEPPYFPMEWDKNGDVYLTEDIGFCEKARENGFDVWVDPVLKVNHIGDYLY